MEGIKIEKITEADNLKAKEFCIGIWDEHGWDKAYIFNFDNIADTFKGQRETFFIAKQGEKIVGCIGIKELPKNSALMRNFYIASDFRGKGLSTLIFQKAKIFAEEKGYKELVLDAFPSNTRALKFYEKHGFEKYIPTTEEIWEKDITPDKFEFRKLKLTNKSAYIPQQVRNSGEAKNILKFEEVSIKDVPLVGGKNASLGEMIVNLTSKGVSVPTGFATTSKAYFYFLEKTGLKEKIKNILFGLNVSNLKDLHSKGEAVRKEILKSNLPKDLEEEIGIAYKELSQKYKEKESDVAVRSSATAEDLPNASFAGQQESYLNIKGKKQLIETVKKCISSLFTDRAIAYREEMKFDHLKIGLSVGIQKMVRSDLGASGVMFSCDTESGFGDVVLINASYGLGENVVKGKVDPDQYYVFETTLKKGFKPILEKKIGSKLIKLIYNKNKQIPTKNIAVPLADRKKFAISDDDILALARWSIIIEDHYKRSMDIEWAKDGKTGKLYIIQARPETVESRKNVNVLEEYILKNSDAKLLVSGLSVGSKIGQGKAHKILSAKDISQFKKGEVLITDATDPDWVPAMKMASAIITDRGGRTCHSAIVGRELGIPTVVGTGNATKKIKTGESVTVSCAEGETGKVYKGIIPFEIKRTDISRISRPPFKVMMNLGDPSQAFKMSFIPNDGVGLAREEFIIANYIKIHPLALLNFKKMPLAVKKRIELMTEGWKDKEKFFVDKLAEGVGKIAAAFYPKKVIVRLSDFKTNEYRGLIGGEIYEPEEENPMIGWRGASRYYSDKFANAFALECRAIKKAREEFGLENISVMVPFCRTIGEGKRVLEAMEKNGLKKGNLKVYVMCEIPSNAILVDEFLDIFDGMSIGSNDLTQLVLGLDRDNSTISGIANENHEAVKKLIRRVIKACVERGKYCGICGQAPSDFPDFAEFLVKEGIQSISLNPDTIIKTILFLSKK